MWEGDSDGVTSAGGVLMGIHRGITLEGHKGAGGVLMAVRRWL